MAKTMKAVIYKGPGEVAVEDVPYPTLEVHTKLQHRKCNHGAIIKLVCTNICGSDQHMVRGRTGAESGLRLGHEMTGEVVQVGPDVEFVKVGDLVSVPFNVACGRCKNCSEQFTQICLNVNPEQPGGAYGFAMMGDWPGGQAEYALVPYADFNLLVIPDKAKNMDKLLDLAMLSDVLPTAHDAAVKGGVLPGKTVFIAGAGPIGIACAACCLQLLGASCVIVADYNEDRLKQAKALGCKTVSLKDLHDHAKIVDLLEAATGLKEVDVAVDCVGYESNGEHGKCRHSAPERSEVLNDLFRVLRAGGSMGVPGLYPPMDPGAEDAFSKKGGLTLDYGNAWNKGISIAQGQCPVKKYNYYLMQCILNGRLHVAEYLNTTIISMQEIPKAYKDFDEGVAKKYVIDPHGMIPKASIKPHAS